MSEKFPMAGNLLDELRYWEKNNGAPVFREAIDELKRYQWQPIETAPKDGTEILGWREDCGYLLIRWSCAEEFLTESEASGWNEDDLFLEDWFCADFISGERLEGSEAPTHWMPLSWSPESGKRDLFIELKEGLEEIRDRDS